MKIPPVNAAQPPLHGLYDDFASRRTPTREDYQRALTSGLVVPDANVLLDLYRYDPEAQDKLLDVLERLGPQLWVPHQVLAEFWRRREDALHDLETAAQHSQEKFGKLLTEAIEELNQWANRTALPDDRVAALYDKLEAGFRDIEAVIRDGLATTKAQQSSDTNADQVLVRLERILDGRVGPRLEPEDEEEAIQEGLRRVAAKEPPGYKDNDKVGNSQSGDYLVWEQTLREASRRDRPVLFITKDSKEDWWLQVRGQRRGPRTELIEEMRSRAGVQLLMTRTDNLLRLARELLDVDVPETTVEDVSRFSTSTDSRVDDWNVSPEGVISDKTSEDLDDGKGWTRDGLEELLRRLALEGPVQQRALNLALKSGGFVAREDVYRLGEYEASRTLRGFTRPVMRISRQLRDEGIIGEGSPDALKAVYDPETSYVQAAGFRVPSDVLRYAD